MKTLSERLRGPIKHPQQLTSQRIEAADSIDELVAALENARETIEWMYGCSSPSESEIEKAIVELHIILAKHK
jgi:hypothetical protein